LSDWIEPHWPVPGRVRAAITTRVSGASAAPYDRFNLAMHVGDKRQDVEANRRQLMRELGITGGIQWLEQVHGTRVVEAAGDGRVITADGCFTGASGLACAVLTADCLPVLLCDRSATRVAAVHAGWRGLAAGILRSAIGQFSAPAGELLAYLGPAISQPHFEVGVEVLEAFYAAAVNVQHLQAVSAAFAPGIDRPMKFHADLYRLARAELTALGLRQIYGGHYCSYADSRRFYSFRRDGQTGRMASLIWLI